MKIGAIMARCWEDESFKQKLLADANATLKAEGVAVPEGVTVKVWDNSDTVINFILPRNPRVEMSDADLDQVAGGKGCVMDIGSSMYKNDPRYDPDKYHGFTGACWVGGASGQQGAF